MMATCFSDVHEIMSEPLSLRNQLLIAMPNLVEPHFYNAVTFVCEHTKEGAMGININQPMELKVSDVLEQMDISTPSESLRKQPVLLGGPVQPERGFILHQESGDWTSTLEVTPQCFVTTSRDILEAIAEGEGPDKFILALGYAGWDAGQLEMELTGNHWLNIDADNHILFDLPYEERRYVAAAKLGIDLALLSTDSGHA